MNIPSHMTKTEQAAELVRLRAAFLVHVRQLIATYPAQAANEAFYLRQAATAQLGRMRSEIRTKGDFSVFHADDLVLTWIPAGAMAQDREVWHDRNACCTQVSSYSVEIAS